MYTLYSTVEEPAVALHLAEQAGGIGKNGCGAREAAKQRSLRQVVERRTLSTAEPEVEERKWHLDRRSSGRG